MMVESTDAQSRAGGIPLIIIRRLKEPIDVEDEIFGYTAISTATNNLEENVYKSLLTNLSLSEDSSDARVETLTENTVTNLQEIATKLSEAKDPEIVIAVHGFNNNFNSVRTWYDRIHKYINNDSTIKKRNVIFIGYRWPSENFIDRLKTNIVNAFNALPILPRIIFFGGLAMSLLLLITLLITYQKFLLLALGLTTITTSLILTLIILRLVVYFRDCYRADYFGTPDLVELVRQLDQAISKRQLNKKVKLSFLGHSLGCSVITKAIRILSDVFDPQSMGDLFASQGQRKPSKEIGQYLQFERLVLVAPDIPVESVIPRRANFLRSALRRFEEAHVFTNEGDLALRLASTTANYFSFPAKTRFSGYRLGNLTVKHFQDSKDKSGSLPKYGIVNCSASGDELPFNYLEIHSSNSEHRNLEEIQEIQCLSSVVTNSEQVPNILSYYDCTDYKENSQNKKGVVSLAVGKPSLNLCDYARLLFALGMDTHGGYFREKSESSKDLIYRLAFAGFEQLCISLLSEGTELHGVCKEKGIQVLLSPKAKHYVSRDEVAGGHFLQAAAAPDSDAGGREFFQGGERFFCPIFLAEAQQGNQEDNRQDAEGIFVVAQEAGN